MMNIGDKEPEILGKEEREREKDANNPTSEKQRFAILDVSRGLALMGIALANFLSLPCGLSLAATSRPLCLPPQ